MLILVPLVIALTFTPIFILIEHEDEDRTAGEDENRTTSKADDMWQEEVQFKKAGLKAQLRENTRKASNRGYQSMKKTSAGWTQTDEGKYNRL